MTQIPTQGEFVFSGYTSAIAKPTTKRISGVLATFRTERMLQPPESAAIPIDLINDLFFYYDDEGIDHTGQPISAPNIPGMSGSPVWKLSESAETIWMPETSLSVIGVQCAWRENEYVRAKSWAYVEQILTQCRL